MRRPDCGAQHRLRSHHSVVTAGLNRRERRVAAVLPSHCAETQDAGMRLALLISLILVATVPAIAAPPPVPVGDGVTIYRCTDAKGRLTLRDSPCNKGERQESRSMLRPKDAPLRPPPPAPVPTTAAMAPPPQVIVINSPRPLYECVAADNNRYLSDTPEGRARWVPLWPVAYPTIAQVPVYPPGQLNVRVDNGHVSGSYQSGGGRVLVPTYAESGGGTWVRDPCYALPQVEVCARLRDQRDTLRRRYTIAQPSERTVLGREERSIGARLSQDCR